MSKEYLEAFRGFKCGMITDNAMCITKSYFDDKFPIIEQALERLEAIDNAKPSEALETLKDMLIGNGCNDSINDYVDNLILPIKQLLQRLEQIDNAVNICKKANEQKYVYIKETYGIIKEKFLDDLDYEILNNRLYVNSRGMYYDFPLKDYGNWWALTKEELENE